MTREEMAAALLDADRARLGRSFPPRSRPEVAAERARIIADAYAAGISRKVIAADLGVTVTTVTRTATRAGLPLRKSKVPPEVAAAACEAYASGLSAKQVALTFGISGPTVIQMVRASGGVVRPPYLYNRTPHIYRRPK